MFVCDDLPGGLEVPVHLDVVSLERGGVDLESVFHELDGIHILMDPITLA